MYLWTSQPERSFPITVSTTHALPNLSSDSIKSWYKKVAVSAALVSSEGEEAYVLSAHVALALLREIPRLQCYDTNHYIDLDKT